MSMNTFVHASYFIWILFRATDDLMPCFYPLPTFLDRKGWNVLYPCVCWSEET